MCFHGNQHPWAIKHPFISLYSKYQSLQHICLPVVNSPIFPSLDDIYCTYSHMGVSEESERALKWSERSKVECSGASERVSGASDRRPVSSHENRILKEPLGRWLCLFARTAHSAHSAHSLCRAPLGYICLNLFGYAELD